MTRIAMQILLSWASKHNNRVQLMFSEYYHIHDVDVIHDELFEGKIGQNIINSRMMMKLISNFEKVSDLDQSFTADQIYH